MLYPIHECIQKLAKDVPEGEIVVKFRVSPKVKPPRRRPSVQNESCLSDYMQVYMQKYREEGKDYQKMPQKIKDLRKKQRKQKKKKARIEDERVYNKVLSSEVNHIYIESKGNVGLYEEPTEVLRIESSTPHVGIGVNYPTAMLNITSNSNNVLIIS